MRAGELTEVDELTLALACAQSDALLVFRTALFRSKKTDYMSWGQTAAPYLYRICVRHYTMATKPWRQRKPFYGGDYEQTIHEYMVAERSSDKVVQVHMLTGPSAVRNTCALCTKRYGSLRKRYGEHVQRWIAEVEQEGNHGAP